MHYVNAHLAAPVFLGSTVTEKRAILSITDVVVLVTNFGANGAHTDAVVHLARVTVVPVLIHELLLGHGERAQLVTE